MIFRRKFGRLAAVAVLGAGPLCTAAEQAAEGVLAKLPRIDAASVLGMTTALASDELEGRAPGSRGEDRTVQFLVDQMKKLGLKPGNTDGTYVQNVPLVGITPRADKPLVFQKGDASERPAWRDDYVAWAKRQVASVSVADSEVVFVGYGAQAPEFSWDDYKGVDVRGKTLVMLIGDPPVPDPADPSKLDEKAFGGRAMTYYGRWTYKYEIGAEKGAAAVLLVHETGPAGYPFFVVQNNANERFNLVAADKDAGRVAAEGWLSFATAEKLFKLGGQDLPALKRAAARRDFRPVSLGVKASLGLANTLRPVQSRNVVGRLEGSDPARRGEHVVYTAHWDHFGIGEPVKGDRIYNGAVDNATGTAGMLEIARAATRLPKPPSRSLLFLAVTAEEQGLLGSEFYAKHPIYPLEKTLAVINLDGLNVHGRTKDLTVVGLGSSDLDDLARELAAEQGRTLRPDAEPEKGFYYRSDHFNFAKVGVPAFDPDEGTDFIGRPASYAQQVRDDYTTNRYHKPQDEISPDWDLSGAVEDLQLFFAMGLRLAEAQRWPEWKPANEFKARRDAMLAGRKR